MPGFDVAAAQKSGYSDDEILSHLTATRKFDIEGARKAGYSNQDIISHLSSTPAPSGGGVPPGGVQRFSRALGEGNPLSMQQAPSDAEIDRRAAQPLSAKLAEVLQSAKETFAPGPGKHAPGSLLNVVHAIPVVGPGIANTLQEIEEKKWPEALGHIIGGLTAPGSPAEPHGPIGPARAAPGAGAVEIQSVGPALKAGVAKVAEVAANTSVGATVGAAVGLTRGHPIIGALAGMKASKYAGKLAEYLKKPAVESVEEVPATAAKPSLITPAEDTVSAPRSQERQAIVDELNKQPGKVAQPSNTVTAPSSAENARSISAPEASNRSKLAQEMAAKMHEAGAEWDQARRLSPGDVFWKTLRSTVRDDVKHPSPATVQIALEHLKALEENDKAPAKVVPITSAPAAALNGKSLDLAQKLAAEMEAPTAEPAKAIQAEKPAASSNVSTLPGWLGTLSENQRESVFSLMRDAGNKANALLEEHNRLRPRPGELAAGGAHIDPMVKAYAIEGMHRALNRGATIDEAMAAGKAEARLTVNNFNSKIPKSAGGYQIMRPEGMADASLEQYGRNLRNVVSK